MVTVVDLSSSTLSPVPPDLAEPMAFMQEQAHRDEEDAGRHEWQLQYNKEKPARQAGQDCRQEDQSRRPLEEQLRRDKLEYTAIGKEAI